MSTSTSRWEPTPRWERRYREVLDAAAAVFAEKSYAGASTRDIAERLGVRQASLYYYFPSKEAALAAICELGVKDFIANLQRIIAEPMPAPEKTACSDRQSPGARCAHTLMRTMSACSCATATTCRTGRAKPWRRWRAPIRT
jgi:AcrR family transcriptional regulator